MDTWNVFTKILHVKQHCREYLMQKRLLRFASLPEPLQEPQAHPDPLLLAHPFLFIFWDPLVPIKKDQSRELHLPIQPSPLWKKSYVSGFSCILLPTPSRAGRTQ